MLKYKILISHPLGEDRMKALNKHCKVHCLVSKENKHEQVMELIGTYDALHVIDLKVDKGIIDAGSNLKIMSNYGVGYDHIDVTYAASKGIAVANTPISTSKATAEYTLGLILSLLRKITVNDRFIRSGRLDDWSSSLQSGNSLKGKTLGILGLGRIGKEVAIMAQAFGMKVIYHNRKKLTTSLPVDYVSLDELMTRSDILSIHAPSTEATFHILNKERLELMEPSSWVINTARGNLIDHSALIKALEERRIKGAALDVFPEEPIIPEALKSMDNVILSPHNGTGTFEDRAAMFEESFGNILAFFDGKKMSGRVV